MIRLNETNLYLDTRKLYRLAGLGVNEYCTNVLMVDQVVDLKDLPNLTGQSKKSLIRMSFYHEIGGFEGIDTRITSRLRKKVTCVNRSQICPKCLIEEPYHRKKWNISLITSCEKHKCLLVHTCNQCNKKINPFRSNIVYCQCGFDLRCSEIYPVNDVRVSQLLSSKLEGKTVSKQKTGINILHSYSFAECLYLLLVFSERVARIYFDKKTVYTAKPNGFELHNILCRTIDVFCKWPNNLKGLIVDMVEFDENANNKKLSLHLFLTGLKNTLPLNNFCLIFEALREVLNELSKDNKRFNRNKESITEFMHNGVDKQKREQIINASIDFSEAAELLGIDKNRLKLLTNQKVISSCKIDGFRTMLDRKYINCLLSQLIQINVDEKNEPTNEMAETITFNSLTKIAKTYSFSYAETVAFIINREITPIKLDESSTGFCKLLFSKEQVNEVLSTKRIPLYIIAEKLQTSKNTVQSWIRGGFLPYSKVKNYYYVIPKDFEEFRNKYISITTILDKYKKTKSVTKMVEILAGKNIVPVSGKRIDGGNCYLYESSTQLKRLIGLES